MSDVTGLKQSDESEETREYFLTELTELERKVFCIWSEFEDARKSLNEDHTRIEKCSSQWKDVDTKLKQLKNIFEDEFETNESKNDIDNDVNDSDNKKTNTNNKPNEVNQVNEKMEIERRLLNVGNDISELLSTKQRVGSLFLRLIVGRVSMRVWTEKNKMLLKDEYGKFKFRTNFVFIAFPILQLIYYHLFGRFEWVLHQWHHGWLCYYYFSLGM